MYQDVIYNNGKVVVDDVVVGLLLSSDPIRSCLSLTRVSPRRASEMKEQDDNDVSLSLFVSVWLSQCR